MFLLLVRMWLFVVPAYYLAKSKGRSGLGYAILTVLSCYFAQLLGTSSPAFSFSLSFILPAVTLGILYVLPAKHGAPGEAYLTITAKCPMCGETVSFPRRREGFAESCPECGEVVTVPTDAYSPKSPPHDRRKPDVTEGEVCFVSFGLEEPADLLAALLNDNGVPARVVGATFIGFVEGYRVIINAADWDQAVRIERDSELAGEEHVLAASGQSAALPDDSETLSVGKSDPTARWIDPAFRGAKWALILAAPSLCYIWLAQPFGGNRLGLRDSPLKDFKFEELVFMLVAAAVLGGIIGANLPRFKKDEQPEQKDRPISSGDSTGDPPEELSL